MHIIRNRNLYFILPGALVAVSLIVILIFGLKGGVDVSGGSLLEISYETERPAVSLLKQRVSVLPLGEVHIQPTGDAGYIVRARNLNPEEKAALLQTLMVEGTTLHEERFTSIGPTIGKELRDKAWIAVGLVSLAIISYIAFAFRHVSEPVASWKYGLVAIATLLHDILIPMGLFAVLGEVRGAEEDSLFIVALLTLLGISVNDTIVVFDRIRENLRFNKDHKIREQFETVVGKSIDQTINTSMTVIIVLAALYFMGPVSTKYFALTLIVCMIAGTYSSIFLASPL